MASISTDANGNRTVQFMSPLGKRHSIRLGKLSAHDANLWKANIEALVSCLRSGLAPVSSVSDWLGRLRRKDPKMLERLVRVGLLEPEQAAGCDQSQLGDFLDGYVLRRSDVKQGTKANYEQATRFLIEFFGRKRLLRTITAGDADEYRVWLLTKVGDNTCRRHCGRAKQFLRAAVRKHLIDTNPFGDMKQTSVRANKAREHYITVESARQVLEACPNSQWRLIFALARFGGLRTPSESLELRWADIDWERNQIRVTSPKTAHHEGKEERLIPLFPELRPYLDEAFFDETKGDSEFVITMQRDSAKNLRTGMKRIVRRAGLLPWPKLFQNLRATRETELAQSYPIHVVCAWMGNSQLVAARHYLQVRAEDFETAAAKPSALQIPVQNNPNSTAPDGTILPSSGGKRQEFQVVRACSEQFGRDDVNQYPQVDSNH